MYNLMELPPLQVWKGCEGVSLLQTHAIPIRRHGFYCNLRACMNLKKWLSSFFWILERSREIHTHLKHPIALIYKFKTFKICLLEMIGSQLTKLFFKNISIFNYFLNTNNLLLLGIFKVLIFEQGRIWKRSS